MASKLFIFNRIISQAGFVGGGTNNAFEISNLDKIRVVVENAGGTNVFTFRVKIKGQSNFTALTTITGNNNSLIDVKTYDELQIESTTFDGPNINLSTTGYKVGAGSPTEFDTFASFPAATGSGDLAWAADTNTLYYDEPSSSTWSAPSAGTVSLTDGQVGYGNTSNQLTSEAGFEYNDTTNTLSVENLNVGGTAIIGALYFPEDARTITALEITNKALTLIGTPSVPSATRLSIAGAPSQTYGTDFIVVGNQLQWTGLGLDGLIIAGNVVYITFN